MSNNHNIRLLPAPASAPEPSRPRPIEQLHPILYHLINRMEVMPPGDGASITEAILAEAVSLAITMLPEDEQVYIVSRIMTDDEIAEERLQSPEIQDPNSHVHLTNDEIRILLRQLSTLESDDIGEEYEESEEYEELEEDEEAGEYEDEGICCVCYDPVDISIPCGCPICSRCLRKSISLSCCFEAEFPPGCCVDFDEATILLAGVPALVHLFRQRSAEYAVPGFARLYCHDPHCSAFIPPGAIQPAAQEEDDATPVGTCLSCGKATCAVCGSRAHRGIPCREEENAEAWWDMMDENKLAGCPECGIVVDLREGCNHIVCICRAEFCFLCGLTWHSCLCPPFRGLHLRVPVRERPGRRPITRGGRAYLADGTEGIPRLPRLRYDVKDEVTLAEVDFAPVIASAPALVPDPGPRNSIDYAGIQARRGIPQSPQLQHHVPADRQHFFNPPLPDRSRLLLPNASHGSLDLTPLALPPPLVPLPQFPPSDRPFIRRDPAPKLPPNHQSNNQAQEAPAEVVPNGYQQAIQRLRLAAAALQDQHDAYIRRRGRIMGDVAREVQQALEPDFAQGMELRPPRGRVHGHRHFREEREREEEEVGEREGERQRTERRERRGSR
ncbi:hypothetical protein V8C42DRAFT_362041 [Trichoderma barbatum]